MMRIRLSVVRQAPSALTPTELLRINVTPATLKTSCQVQSTVGGVSCCNVFLTEPPLAECRIKSHLTDKVIYNHWEPNGPAYGYQ